MAKKNNFIMPQMGSARKMALVSVGLLTRYSGCLSILLLVATGVSGHLVAGDVPVKIGGNYEVRAIADVAYGEKFTVPPLKNSLDIYLPKDAKDFPIVFFVHGGGWTIGDKWPYFTLGHLLAKNGIGAVMINYRLSPAVKHPAHVKDVAKALDWTFRNAEKFGARPDRVFLAGHSAGAHLISLLATDESYLKEYDRSPRDIRGVIGISGVYTFEGEWLDKDMLRGWDWPGRRWRTGIAWVITQTVLGPDAHILADASPIRHTTGKEPPFLLAYGAEDLAGCEKMAKEFSQRLREKKVEVKTLRVPMRSHASIIALAMVNEADPVTQSILEFISAHSDLVLKPRTP
jgi:acetyl esterase/lipase